MRPRNGAWVLIVVAMCLPVLVLSIGDTVLDLALPSIARNLGAGISDLQWVINAYLLAFATPLLAIGSIADRIGRRRMLTIGLILFGVFALFGALATSIEMLIASRALLGFAGAMIFPSTLSVLAATFREPAKRARAIGIWAGTFAVGAGIGPLVGGLLLEYFNWNSVFYMNIPVVLLSLTGIYLYVPESKGFAPQKPDFAGVLISMISLFAIVFGITIAGEHGWDSPHTLISIAIFVCGLTLFVWWEKRQVNPLLPLGLFRNMSFTGANISLVMTMFALLGFFFVFSQYLQTVQGYSPLTAGLMQLPLVAALFITTMLSPKMSLRFGVKITVSLGVLIAGIGMLYASSIMSVNTPYPMILSSVVILAAGLGLTMPASVDSIMGSLPVGREGIGSAMDETTQQVGGILGVAVLGALINNVYRNEVSSLPVIASLSQSASETAMRGIQEAHILAEQFPQAIAAQIVEGCNEAFVSGMTESILIGGIILVVSAVVTLFILPSRIRSDESMDGRTSL